MSSTASRMIFPMIFGHRHSDKLGDGASTPLQLVRLQIEQKVNADFPLIHQIATTMTFKNLHNIVVEGAFEFTLPDKATICGYGLDVDGVIVDGVVVEKQAARIIFEKEVRKRVDPGFVELVTGNVFRTRVYPIEPQKTRTVRVIYQDQATPTTSGFLYQIPIQFQTRLESLDVILTCFSQTSSTSKPTLLNSTHQILSSNGSQFVDNGKGQCTAEWHLTNVDASVNSDQTLSYTLPGSLKPVLTAVEKDTAVGAYFAVSCTLPKPMEQRIDRLDCPTKTVCILWDASLSRSNANETRLLELKALQKIFSVWLTRVQHIDILLVVFRNDVEEPKLFQVRSNNWNDFLKLFEHVPYDGATNLAQLSSISLIQMIDYYFLFSDCVSTMNNDQFLENFCANFKAPIWIFNGNYLHQPYDSDFIRYLTQYNDYGGGYLNREKLEDNPRDLIKLIETIQIKYMKLQSTSSVQQIYPSHPVSIELNSDRFLLVGQIPLPLPTSIQFELEFSMNNQTSRLPISINVPSNEGNHFGLIRRLWASQKLNQLNVFKEKYKSDILSLGLEYSLVSQFTSLLVLETLQQHLQYHVCPAKSRQVLYNQYLQLQTAEVKIKINELTDLVQLWREKCLWYDQVITDVDRHRAYLPIGNHSMYSQTPRNTSSIFDAPYIYSSSSSVATSRTPSFPSNTLVNFYQNTAAPSPFKFGATAPTSNTSAAGSPFVSTAPPPPAFLGFGSSSSKQSDSSLKTSAITLNDKSTEQAYMARISSSNNLTSAYTVYLSERTLNHRSPSFYFDVASYFFSPSSKASVLDKFNQQQQEKISTVTDPKSLQYGLRILTNILELELEAPQLYRTVGYKFMQLKQWQLALSIFRKVYSLRSDEPQSLRDLALVLIELGQYDQALESFKRILTETWDERFINIYCIVLLDLNRLLVLMTPTQPGIDLRLVRHLPMDIRIVVQWDTPDTLIQLLVKEPTGQICGSTQMSRTGIGGSMTKPFFQVDQPIEYVLRQAVNGIYSISVEFQQNAQHTLTGVTTVLVYIYKYFGSTNEEKQIQTVRLTDLHQTIDVGQVEFGDQNLERLKDELDKSRDECHRLQNQLIRNEQSTQSTIKHLDVTCDGCLITPIVGDRYKCFFCPNIDFCSTCQSSTSHCHDSQHPLICIRDSKLYQSSIYLQNRSEIIHFNTQCVSCSVSPIVGLCYRCVICQVNLCEKCDFLGLHDVSHQRLKIPFPQ